MGIIVKYFGCLYVYFFMVTILYIYVYIVIGDYLCAFMCIYRNAWLFMLILNKCVKLYILALCLKCTNRLKKKFVPFVMI